MPTPLTDFEANFRSAETLLKVFRLLDTTEGPQTKNALIQHLRELLMAPDDEEILLLLNEHFLGAIRENADVHPGIFKHESLCMLLRQAVVAACSAIDVYYPALLREHLPHVIAVKQRNFIPIDKNSRDFFKEFSLSMDECLRMLSDPKPEEVLGDLFVEYLKRKTLSNTQGVAVSLQILGVEDPWNKIAQRLDQSREALARQFEAIISRRNDIVHRGDRSSKDPKGPVTDITFSWTDSHVHVARSVVLASEELVAEQIQALPTVTTEPLLPSITLPDV
jgi:RiboL-PSP-HEPN